MKNVKNLPYIYATLLSTLNLFIFIYFYYHTIIRLSFFYISPTIINGLYINYCFLIICSQWIMMLVKNKKTTKHSIWLKDFLHTYQDDFKKYENKATKNVYKYVHFKLFNFTLYALICIFLITQTMFHPFTTASFEDINLFNIVIKVLIQYFIVFIIYTIISVFIYKKLYECYVNDQTDYPIYILMTNTLLQMQGTETFLDYELLINISALLSRGLYFKESLDYLQLWKKNAKRISKLYQLLYLENCIEINTMLNNNEAVEQSYLEFQQCYNQNQKLHKNHIVQQLNYLVSLYYAFHSEDWNTIIDLEKTKRNLFNEDSNDMIYIYYQAFLHTDPNHAQELLEQNPDNPFFTHFKTNAD